LAEEQARGLYSFDGRDLLAELEELHGNMDGVEMASHGNLQSPG
jgi:hypothetical protein